METSDFEIIRLELKYCERCGGLWMRTRDSGDVYCPLCVAEMLDLPRPRPKKTIDAQANQGIHLVGQWEEWTIGYGERGNA